MTVWTSDVDSDKGYWKYLHSLALQKPARVSISSFGLYLMVSTFSGDKWEDWKLKNLHQPEKARWIGPRHVLEQLRKNSETEEVRLLIGVSRPMNCMSHLGHGHCPCCMEKYRQTLKRLVESVKGWDERFQWRFVSDLHLKTTIWDFDSYTRATLGGINFSGSGWADAATGLRKTDSDVVRGMYDLIWESSAAPITAENLALRAQDEYGVPLVADDLR